MAKSLEKYQHFLGFLSYKYSLTADDLNKDFEEFCETEKNNLFITSLEDEYKTYLDKNEEKLQKRYNDDNNLLAVAKLSQPLKKDFTTEALVRVKLDY